VNADEKDRESSTNHVKDERDSARPQATFVQQPLAMRSHGALRASSASRASTVRLDFRGAQSA
jgi:hypothetical protein